MKEFLEVAVHGLKGKTRVAPHRPPVSHTWCIWRSIWKFIVARSGSVQTQKANNSNIYTVNEGITIGVEDCW